MAIVTHPANDAYRSGFESTFGKKAIPNSSDVPRRNRIDLMTAAEIACLNAVAAIEVMGCDERLTQAQILIQRAQALVADVVDSRQP